MQASFETSPPRSAYLLEDLLVIAGVPTPPDPDFPTPAPAAIEIGRLVAAATHLDRDQVNQLIEFANELRVDKEENREN